MGVHGLWELLAPVGRRVSVENLSGKKLAIDASIWMIQFMKAMRDEKGEMVRSAHLLGFFRRICKLLFLRTKPVFVFDGGTPALKRRTVIARRRQRENAQAKIRKTAEKLLLNHLKEMRLKELAEELERQRQANDAKGKKIITDQVELANEQERQRRPNDAKGKKVITDQLELAKKLERQRPANDAKGKNVITDQVELADEQERQGQTNDAKGKKVITDQVELIVNNLEGSTTVPFRCRQEALDEMLAASTAAEEDESFTANASNSGREIPYEEDDDSNDEEVVLPAMNGKVDPAVLASLPPSMQLDLLVQMRERLIAENRQKYQQVKKAPAKFSELQIQAYLKTVAFRREIDEVQKSAAGKGVGGVQTSRIASEANREFIFSSSFTGDKQILTSAGGERHGEKPHQTISEPPPSESLERIASTKSSTVDRGPVANGPERVFDKDIETYVDERGHVRVSKVRAMGIRMTRDLQRNLDLMKEKELDIAVPNEIASTQSIVVKNVGGVLRRFPDKVLCKETPYQGTDRSAHLDDRNHDSTCGNAKFMEISFEDDGSHICSDDHDNLFARLVAGDDTMVSSADNNPLKKLSLDSDCDWEGVTEEKGDSLTHYVNKESNLSLAEGGSNDESEVEWVDGGSDVLNYAAPSPTEARKTASKGVLEEEADFQEAIMRSLEDARGQKSSDQSTEDDELKEALEMPYGAGSVESVHQEIDKAGPSMPLENFMKTDKSSYEVVTGVERLESEARMNSLNTDFPGGQLAPSMTEYPGSKEGLIDKPHPRYPSSHANGGNLLRESGCKDSTAPFEGTGAHLMVASDVGGHVSTCANSCSGVSSQVSDRVLGGTSRDILADAQQCVLEAGENYCVVETTEQGESSVRKSTISFDASQELPMETNYDYSTEQKGHDKEEFIPKDDKEQPIEVTEASLEKEMLNLSKERTDLGDEQRKLERNAEAVSGEMFAECQELLQMFGLPYIIAPMEAEAQCAYMELENLVDGVVTDDSDVFLFGARSVYKNIFDERKYVETYFMKDIENELGLTREKLIRMALLLGSDYTEGVSGIGIVNAIEVMNAFPEEDGLCKFREWIESPDPTILGKFDGQTGPSSRKRGSKVSDNDVGCSNSNMEGLAASDQTDSQSMDYSDNTKKIFMDKHRNVSKNWHIPSSFPSEAVVSAYDSPQVDKSTDPFSWGKPDLFVLRKLCWEKFGWGTQKADELVLPVLKEYNKHETQLRLEAFYTFNERFAKIRSKRIKKAVRGTTGNMAKGLMDDSVQEPSKCTKKRKLSAGQCREDKSNKPSSGAEDGVAIDEGNSTEKSTAKGPKKRKHAEPVPSEARNPKLAEGRRKHSQGSSTREGGRSVRGRTGGNGRREKKPVLASADRSCTDGSCSDYEKDKHVENNENLGGPPGVRKSARTRKAVNYIVEDLEIDEPGKADQDEVTIRSHDEVAQEEAFEDPGEKIPHEAGDPSFEFEELSSGVCLEMGGGFCTDGGEPEPGETTGVSLGENVDPCSEADLSREYLEMGGGFCLDEDGTNKDPVNVIDDDANPAHCCGVVVVEDDPDVVIGPAARLVSSPARALEYGFQDSRTGPSNSEQNADHSTRIIRGNHSTLAAAISSTESARNNDSGTALAKSFCAMPNLRRKRRKG